MPPLHSEVAANQQIFGQHCISFGNNYKFSYRKKITSPQHENAKQMEMMMYVPYRNNELIANFQLCLPSEYTTF